MSKEILNEVPLKYKIEEGVENPRQISVKCKDADGNENKELIPVFGNGDPKELLIELYGRIRILEERYSWTEGENNPKAKHQFQHFGTGLRGEHLRKWNKLIDRNRSYTSATFIAKAVKLIEKIFGEDAYSDQCEYLYDTKKPHNMSAVDWVDRIEVINAALEKRRRI